VVALSVAVIGCGGPEPEPDVGIELSTTRRALATVSVEPTVAAGAYHAVFLDKKGQVWAWGQNTAGQLGRGNANATPSGVPEKVGVLPPIQGIAAGAAHTLALDVEGQVWVWGQNASGQAGLGTAGGTVLVPTKVPSLSGIQAVAAGANFSLALDEQGRLWAWGQNTAGQVGIGSTSAAVATPALVAGLPSLRAVAAGLNHVLALDTGGRVWAWGQNSFGQVGTGGTSAAVLAPYLVTTAPRAKAVAAGAGHSLVVAEEFAFGKVWGWGQNNFGQVGTGTASTSPVLQPTAVTGAFAGDVTAVVAGHYFSLVQMGDGQVKAWGQNTFGQLGNGSTANSASPVNISGMGDGLGIAAGAQHALALRPGCPVWGWGSNSQGQLGTGSTSTSPTTTPVPSQLINTFYFDGDLDGYGDEFSPMQACYAPEGFVEEIDCDDFTPTTYPGAPELCNGVDDSCDGVVDEGNPGGGEECETGELGVCAVGTSVCTGGSMECVRNEEPSAERCDSLDNDCDGEVDEGNPEGLQECATGQLGVCGEGVTYCTQGTVHCVQKQAASSEVCDSRDNDCDGEVDDGLAFQLWHRDQDGDSYGVTEQAVLACKRPEYHTAQPGDCDDTNSTRNPGATEVCDGQDNDCDGVVDEGLGQVWYRDADGDGYGNASQSTQACVKPAGYVSNASDCNDSSSSIRPGATEVCDGTDNNCNGAVDEGVGSTWYRDADGDGYGRANLTTQACSQPSGYVSNASDCNDTSSSIRPGASEVCDGADNNCNGGVDEGVGSTWYRDADGDGYGTSGQSTAACAQPAGYVSNASDCNDASSSSRPGATEVCDGQDNNCNGTVDDGVGSTWYRDADGDGYGKLIHSAQACAQPLGYVSNAGDCNDLDEYVSPEAWEVCDGRDNDCDGGIDENSPRQCVPSY
jgi:alpha-tubulin suppressor-like RCC1 family protein